MPKNIRPAVKTADKVKEIEAKWHRALADYQNLEKRVAKDQADFVKFANANLIAKLLTIMDDLNRAQSHLSDPGLKLIIDRFEDTLNSEGVSQIEALNKPFDAHTMEVVETVTGTPNTVIEVLSPGYKLHDKILRPAKVKVGAN